MATVRIREEAEEKLRLRNQFRSLDDDEASFLDAVLESSKTKEKAVREETKIQLEAFRRLQNETSPDSEVITEQEDGGGTNGKADIRPSSWATSSRKKRKNGPGEVIKGLKFRKASHVADDGSSHSACVDVPENQLRGSASTSGAVVVEEADMLVQNKVDEETSVGSQETKGLLKRPTLLSADYESDSSF